MKIVITGACAVSSRNVLRSLKMSEKFKNATFIGWDMCSILYGVYSHNFDRMYKVPGVNDPKYREVIQKILDDEKPDAVMVLPEVEVSILLIYIIWFLLQNFVNWQLASVNCSTYLRVQGWFHSVRI